MEQAKCTQGQSHDQTFGRDFWKKLSSVEGALGRSVTNARSLLGAFLGTFSEDLFKDMY